MPAKWVQALLRLQEHDLSIRNFEQRLKLLPEEMSNLKDRRDALVASTAAAADEARKIERQIKTAESEVARLTEESQKLQQQSAMVKKNTEYQAMLSTIALNKNKIGDIEAKVIELLDQFEAAKVVYRRVKADNDAAVKNAKTEFEELIAFSSDVKERLASLRENRKNIPSGVDGDTLSRYNALLGGKQEGSPLVKVESGICGHCHLRITPQAQNNIQKGAVTICDNCQHLIYDEGFGQDHADES